MKSTVITRKKFCMFMRECPSFKRSECEESYMEVENCNKYKEFIKKKS